MSERDVGRDSVLLAAFAGWNDAGEAATAVVEHLERVWHAELVTSVDPEDYYDFTVHRPHVRIDESGIRSVDWPTNRISRAAPRPGLDMVLIRGIEPNNRWRSFCTELLDMATELGVRRVINLGALLADVPHTRPVPVSMSTTDDTLASSLGLERSRYEGPTGIVGVLQDAATRRGFVTASLWAAVPHYVAQSPCPKATLVLLRRVEDLLDVPVPLGEVPEEADAWQRGVDELATEDPEVAEYVRRLEQARDTTELPEASGEHIAREFERYLRRRDE